MRQTLTILSVLTICVAFVFADDIFTEMSDRVEVRQDSLISELLKDKSLGITRKEVVRQGWRVQVYSNNNGTVARQEADTMKLQMEEAFSPLPVYGIYDAPFWKVRIGNFLTEDEAKTFRDSLLVRFPVLQPETYIVRDQIVIIQ